MHLTSLGDLVHLGYEEETETHPTLNEILVEGVHGVQTRPASCRDVSSYRGTKDFYSAVERWLRHQTLEKDKGEDFAVA